MVPFSVLVRVAVSEPVPTLMPNGSLHPYKKQSLLCKMVQFLALAWITRYAPVKTLMLIGSRHPINTILGVDLNNKLCARADLYAKCVAARDAGGQVKGVAIMKDGIILGVGMDNKLYIRSLKSLKRPSEEATEKEAGALEEETVNPNLDLLLIRSRRPVVSLLCKMVLFLVLA